MLEFSPFVQDVADDLGLVLAADAMFGFEVAPRQTCDLAAKIFEFETHIGRISVA